MSTPIITHPEISDSILKAKGVSIVAFCDTVRRRSDGTFTIRIRITFQRFPKLYTTKIYVTLEEFEKMILPRPRGEAKEKVLIVYALLKKAYDVVLKINEFSFEEFDLHFKGGSNKEINNVFTWFDQKIIELQQNDQIGTADYYKNALSSIKRFYDKKSLSFKNINISFLTKYEQWMISEGNQGSIGFNMRALRHIFNRAINDKRKFLEESINPFKDYRIPSPRNLKKALPKKDVKAIFEYESIDMSVEHFYKDLWIFTYLCNGINMKDIALLKYDNINGDNIEFSREKIKKSNANGKPIVISMVQEVRKIIDRWGTKPRNKKNYIFPIITSSMDLLEQRKSIKQAVKQCNKYIRRIAKELEIEKDVTTYTARHSHATILRNSGVSPYKIGEGFGHSSTKTTDDYFGSLEDDDRKEIAEKLTDW